MHAITRRSFSASAILASLLSGRTLAEKSPAGFDLPADAEAEKILSARVDALSAGQGSIGMVAGLMGPRGPRIVSAGHRDKGDVRALTGDTVFEFGSVGKVFTALLLADMVVHREVSLDDPVAGYLPGSVKLPDFNGRAIRLIDLATHTAGLPFMPELPPSSGSTAPAYTVADLYGFLARFKLSRDIGSTWDYSNIGYWLLGEALSARAHADIETLLRERIFAPLKMAHSGFSLSPKMKSDLAIGHNASLQPSPSVADIPVYNLMPAAGVRFNSTANDALTFLSAAMGYTASPLAAAFALTVNTHRPIPGSANLQALGWTLIPAGSDQVVFRDGGTFGYASCLVWDRDRRVAAVVLANCVTDVSDIGRHIMQPDFPLATPVVAVHMEIHLSPENLARYVGRYEAQGEGIFTIALDGDHLTIEAPADWGLPKLRIRPENQQDFFAAELPLRVTFQTRQDGTATRMTVYPPRGQKGVAAQKVG